MNIEIFEEIDSTNEYLKRQKDNKNYDIVMAHKQTKGKGTRGRVWLSTEGILMFSIVIKEDKNISMEEYTKLPLVVGMALLSALEEIEKLPFMFKWTNDIYLYDKKLSGILTEKIGEDFIVGVGINLNILEFGDLNAISLKAVSGKDYDKLECLKSIVNKIKEYIYKFYRGEWNLILGEINEKNYLKNKEIKFIGVDRIYDGVVKGINNDGELILEEKGKNYNLRIGEVSTK
ncbi:MAG: biotin--[acetyl-CoA-carboxylase] ligase [Fusobacteriaceae bacterium]|jgi:BirA family biotin operon repressor/biotin-[acetyl-CoA-carboxylase] ligase|nr:biotin--[acetyl-CoA-carboxylase] ligase [Fusobacteriaceae bacterium]